MKLTQIQQDLIVDITGKTIVNRMLYKQHLLASQYSRDKGKKDARWLWYHLNQSHFVEALLQKDIEVIRSKRGTYFRYLGFDNRHVH